METTTSSTVHGQSGDAGEEQEQQTVRVSGPASLLALVPHLLGFQPSDSVVVIGTAPPTGQIRLTLRYDLPDPPDAEISAEIARHATEVLAAQELETAAVVGYGPGPAVTPVADALQEAAIKTGLQITELLRAENQLYWSYVCANPRCCAPEGTPYTLEHPAVESLAASRGPVLASRGELAASIAPATGTDAEIMAEATRRAEEHAVSLVERMTESGRQGSARRLIGTAGVEAVTEAISMYQRGEEIPAGHGAAWLTVVLQNLRVRDDAWCRMDPELRRENLRLWSDLTRLAQPGYVAPPASLLAFVAWQSGNGALANVALDRALEDNPRYRMAHLLRQAIDSGAPPSLAKIPMTPEEVAASYDEVFDETEDEDSMEEDGDEDQGAQPGSAR